MSGTQYLFMDLKGTLKVWARGGIIALGLEQPSQIIQARGHTEMIGFCGLLPNLKRPLIIRVRGGVIAEHKQMVTQSITQSGCSFVDPAACCLDDRSEVRLEHKQRS